MKIKILIVRVLSLMLLLGFYSCEDKVDLTQGKFLKGKIVMEAKDGNLGMIGVSNGEGINKLVLFERGSLIKSGVKEVYFNIIKVNNIPVAKNIQLSVSEDNLVLNEKEFLQISRQINIDEHNLVFIEHGDGSGGMDTMHGVHNVWHLKRMDNFANLDFLNGRSVVFVQLRDEAGTSDPIIDSFYVYEDEFNTLNNGKIVEMSLIAPGPFCENIGGVKLCQVQSHTHLAY